MACLGWDTWVTKVQASKDHGKAKASKDCGKDEAGKDRGKDVASKDHGKAESAAERNFNLEKQSDLSCLVRVKDWTCLKFLCLNGSG